MDNGTGLSASDVALLNRDSCGDMWGGNSMMWIFALLILAGGGFGGFGGWGNNAANAIGYENLATSNEVQRGFEAQNSASNQREILAAVNAGTAESIAATNQTLHDTVDVLTDKYSELQRDIAGLAVGQANALASQNECCGNIRLELANQVAGINAGIARNNYDAAIRDAATNANFTSQIQSVKDMIAQDKIAGLQQQVNSLELQNAVAGVVRYPTTTTYGVPSPCFGGCGCGNI